MSTTLPQSQWLDLVVRKIEQECPSCHGLMLPDQPMCPRCRDVGVVHPYAETGTAGWLRDRPCKECRVHYQTHSKVWGAECPSCHGSGKRGSEWPSLVYLSGQDWGTGVSLEYWTSVNNPAAITKGMSYVHALDLLDAFALLEEALAGYWERTKAVTTGKDIYEWFKQEKQITIANSPGELLDKIMAEEEKP